MQRLAFIGLAVGPEIASVRIASGDMAVEELERGDQRRVGIFTILRALPAEETRDLDRAGRPLALFVPIRAADPDSNPPAPRIAVAFHQQGPLGDHLPAAGNAAWVELVLWSGIVWMIASVRLAVQPEEMAAGLWSCES